MMISVVKTTFLFLKWPSVMVHHCNAFWTFIDKKFPNIPNIKTFIKPLKSKDIVSSMKSEDINMNKFLTPICLFHRHHPKLPFYKWPWTRSAYQILESFSCLNQSKPVTLMLVTDVRDQMCWWQVWNVGHRFRMLVTD